MWHKCLAQTIGKICRLHRPATLWTTPRPQFSRLNRINKRHQRAESSLIGSTNRRNSIESVMKTSCIKTNSQIYTWRRFRSLCHRVAGVQYFKVNIEREYRSNPLCEWKFPNRAAADHHHINYLSYFPRVRPMRLGPPRHDCLRKQSATKELSLRIRGAHPKTSARLWRCSFTSS